MLYAGAVSFVPNVPSRDISLSTAEAMRAVGETVHPDAIRHKRFGPNPLDRYLPF